MDRITQITKLVASIESAVEEYFELATGLLDDPSVPERIDKAIVLYESVPILRKQIEMLERLRYRMQAEEGEV